MKRVVPAIIILITLSVAGILFTQVQWIRSARQVRQEQYQQAVTNVISTVKTAIQEQFMKEQGYMEYFATEELKQQALSKTFTAQFLSTETISGILRKTLNDKGIQEPFEFSVYNIYQFPIVSSAGFQLPMKSESHLIKLTPDVYLPNTTGEAEEILYLYLKTPNFYAGRLGLMVVTAVILLLIVIAAFALTLKTLINQRQLSSIKSDFINNMTHEFKTPLATISLAADALSNKKVMCDEEKILYYSGMIKAENKRMNKQVETILQAARLEKNEIQMDLVPIDAHVVIQKVADTLALRVAEKAGSLALKLRAERHLISADEVHFSNIVFNLIDNAIKYAREVPLELLVETKSAGKMLIIRIQDNGVGMTKETVKHIFERFYRAHTGNLHNVKGFGLGLSYVKSMVDAQDGKIRVESTPGKGSVFTVSFPLAGKQA
jgi:two-component system phosphate regulon sensor histidine kinase PhoR